MGCKSVLFSYGNLKLLFPDVEVSPGSWAVPKRCRVRFFNINSLHGNRDELAIAATKFDMADCAETNACVWVAFAWLQSSNSAVDGSFVPGKDWVFLLRVYGRRLNYCHLFLLSIVTQVWTTERLIVFLKLRGASNRSILSLYFVLYLISTVSTQSGRVHASLMLMHGVAAFDFATVADCSQLV